MRKREAAEGRELFLHLKRGQGRGGRVKNMGKATPQSSWRENGKVETAAGTELKREKGERRGFKFH